MALYSLVNSMVLTGATQDLSSVISKDMVSGVFDQILSLLPVIIPALIGFIGFRKALGFVLGMIKKA